MAVTTILPGNASITATGQAVTIPLVSIGNASITPTGQAVSLINTINADPIDINIGISAGVRCPGTGINRDNDITWWATDNNRRGVIDVEVDTFGQIQSSTILDADIPIVVTVAGTPIVGTLVDTDDVSYINIPITLVAEWYSISGKENWVAWSKIGEASFVMDRSNEAGYRPMDWSGWALRVLPLEEMAVVYGDNGICMMYPVDSPAASFGFKNIASIGIKSAYSVGGSEHVHYFITTKGELWRLTKQGPELLGFKEFLSPLVNPILLYEEDERRLFIADNSTGYIFKDGLGGGCECITGVSGGYYAGPHDFTDHPIEIMTDVIDLGHRGIKTTTFIEVGTDTTEDMYVAVDFRYTKAESWRTSAWTLLNPEGVARIQVAGVEFRIRLKQLVYDEVRIDYINVRHQRPDKRFLRGPLYEQPDQGEA